MRYTIIGLLASSLLLSGCNKLENLDGNNLEFQEKHFEIEEVISMVIPNDQFSFGGFLNCTSLPFGATQDYNAFIPTVNPNPYAHLTEDIIASKVKMELTNIPNCDFDMLESVEIFMCDNAITSEAQFVLYDEANPNNAYNAVKLGEFLNFSSGVGDVIYLDVTETGKLDQFIHAGNFQTYAKMVFDKAFTEDSAIIKTTITLGVKLINEE
jgi:hypothetical protein